MIRAAVLAGLAWTGCASSPANELNDLESRASQCGEIEHLCYVVTDASAVLACMNQALASGTTFEATWEDNDDKMFVITTYVFADGGRAREFISTPDDFGGPTTLTELPSCAGPFTLTTDRDCAIRQVLSIDGCP